MQLTAIEFVNFRCFADCTINFAEHTLIMGPNDVGKTNLLHALRLLLDPQVSPAQLEPTDGDFCAYTDSNEFSIWLRITAVTEQCIRSKLGKYVDDDGNMWLGFLAQRTGEGGTKTYQIVAGRDKDDVTDLQGRPYLKGLNLKWVGANRDISTLLRRERRNLLEVSQAGRTKAEIGKDELKLEQVRTQLNEATETIKSVSFVSRTEKLINDEMAKLSAEHEDNQVTFTFSTPDSAGLLETMDLSSRINDKIATLGGDGRKNQVFMSLWSASNRVESIGGEPQEVTLFFFEEPEAHLHPHQQRRLAEYLAGFEAQTFVTTHSPHIAARFHPNAIVRLFNNGNGTCAAGNGANDKIGQAISDLEFRLNILPAEAYFSDCVLLVEGPSERVFYHALADALDISLDRLNISILTVEGVGFDIYTELFGQLNIWWALRTDNDFPKTPKKLSWYAAGVRRGISAWLCDTNNKLGKAKSRKYYEALAAKMLGIAASDLPAKKAEAVACTDDLEAIGVFLATKDLEEDLYESSVKVRKSLKAFFGTSGKDDTIAAMKVHKATFMYRWVKRDPDILAELRDTALAKPLMACKQIREG